MKYTLIALCLLAPWTVTFAIASDRLSITYSGEDYEYVIDHGNDVDKTCLAAGKGALWQACVRCAGNAPSGDACKIGTIETKYDENEKICHGFATAKTSSAALVHCVEDAP
jgi:hypothetical protein